MDRRTRSILVGLAMGVIAVAGATVVATAGDDGEPEAEAEAELRLSPDMAEPALVGGDVTGDEVPDDPFERLGGGLGSLADYRGHPLVVNFFGSWCEPCKDEMPAFQEVHADLGRRVAFVGLAVRDSARDARAFAESFGVTFDLGRDPAGALLEAFDAVRMPSTFFVSAAGRVVADHGGALTGSELRALVAEHLGVS